MADRGHVDEAQEALCGFVVAGGVLELVEAALDEVAQPVKGSVHGHAQLAGLAHRDHRHDVARLHGFSNPVRVIATIRQQDGGLWQVVVHDEVKAQIVRCLARRNVRPHGQACAIDAEVDLGREATSRTAKTLPYLTSYINEISDSNAPLIVGGDFNRKLAESHDDAWHSLSYRKSVGLTISSNSGPSKCSLKGNENIDYILTNKHHRELYSVEDEYEYSFSGPYESWPSDHCPVVVNFLSK